MKEQNSQNSVNALLAEYEKAIVEVQNVIQDISVNDLTFVVDNETINPDCKSIQTILTHIISSGYSYCIYIQNFRGITSNRPEKVNRMSTSEYKKDLHAVFQFTRQTFAAILDKELEESDNTKKIITSWRQLYDIEQLMEHAIVHILRHRRQVEKFKIILKAKNTISIK
jgi:hypothetical protein